MHHLYTESAIMKARVRGQLAPAKKTSAAVISRGGPSNAATRVLMIKGGVRFRNMERDRELLLIETLECNEGGGPHARDGIRGAHAPQCSECLLDSRTAAVSRPLALASRPGCSPDRALHEPAARKDRRVDQTSVSSYTVGGSP